MTISAKPLFEKIVAFILRLEAVYNALLAVLTSASVVLCTYNMNCYTKRALLFFLGCVLLLIFLIPESRAYNDVLRSEKSKNNNNNKGVTSTSLNLSMKELHRGKEARWKWIIFVCFVGLLACLSFFLVNARHSIDADREINQSVYREQLHRIESKIDSLEKSRERDADFLKELKLSIDQLDQPEE